VGHYDHPKGPGAVKASVSYASRKELDVKLSWSEQKKGQTNLAASNAAKAKVEELIFHNSDVSGDFTEVQRQAAAAAAEHLPEGSSPTVEITWRGNHDEHSPKDVMYDVRNPSLCTVGIYVPTTTTAAPWSRTDTEVHVKKDESGNAAAVHVETDAAAGKVHTEGGSAGSVEVKKGAGTDTSATHKSSKTHNETAYGVTWDEIRTTAT
jgi:hypothetical protein